MKRFLVMLIVLILGICIVSINNQPDVRTTEETGEVIIDKKHWKNEKYYRYTDMIRNDDGTRTLLLRPTAPAHMKAPNQVKVEEFTQEGKKLNHVMNTEREQNMNLNAVLGELYRFRQNR